jgi:peptidoglycan/LPS O-acetylase OafA/YrhL
MLIHRHAHWKAITVLFSHGVGAYTAHYCLMNTVSSIVPWPYNSWLTWIRPYGAVLHHSPLANMPHFLIGVIAGYIFLRLKKREEKSHEKIQWVSELVFWFCLAGIFILVSTGLEDMVQIPYAPYGFPVVPLLITAAIISAPFSFLANKCLDSFPLRSLGIISYGIYLYHVPCLNMTYQYMTGLGMNCSESWAILGIASLALTVLIATVSYITIEKPILRLSRKI